MSGATGFEPSFLTTQNEHEAVPHAGPPLTEAQFSAIVSKYGSFDWHGLRLEPPHVLETVLRYLSTSFQQLPSQNFTYSDAGARETTQPLFADAESNYDDTSTSSRHLSTPATSVCPASTLGNSSHSSVFNNKSFTQHDQQKRTEAFGSSATTTGRGGTLSKRKDAPLSSQKSDEKCRYYCISGMCKGLSWLSTYAILLRHEEGHWVRYPCKICHQQKSERDRILKLVNCQCADVDPTHFAFHLEVYRLEHKKASQDALRLYKRKGSLEKHVRDDHQMSHYYAHSYAQSWEVRIKEFTACGICTDTPVLRDYQSTAAHMWQEHWQKGHNMTSWSDDRTVNKLLGVRRETFAIVQQMIKNKFPNVPFPAITWHKQDVRELRMQLELGRLGAEDLARLAIRNADVQQNFMFGNPNSHPNDTSHSLNPFDNLGHDLFYDLTNAFVHSEDQEGQASASAPDTNYNGPPNTIGPAQASNVSDSAPNLNRGNGNDSLECNDNLAPSSSNQIMTEYTQHELPQPPQIDISSTCIHPSQSLLDASAPYPSHQSTRIQRHLPLHVVRDEARNAAAAEPSAKSHSQKSSAKRKMKNRQTLDFDHQRRLANPADRIGDQILEFARMKASPASSQAGRKDA